MEALNTAIHLVQVAQPLAELFPEDSSPGHNNTDQSHTHSLLTGTSPHMSVYQFAHPSNLKHEDRVKAEDYPSFPSLLPSPSLDQELSSAAKGAFRRNVDHPPLQA